VRMSDLEVPHRARAYPSAKTHKCGSRGNSVDTGFLEGRSGVFSCGKR